MEVTGRKLKLKDEVRMQAFKQGIRRNKFKILGTLAGEDSMNQKLLSKIAVKNERN
jgi:hypothetical protein